MPTLIKWRNGAAHLAEDPFTTIEDDQDTPRGDVILSLARFERDGEWLMGSRKVGVRLGPGDPVEALEGVLPRLAVVSLVFPKFRDGRAYSAARVLRERYSFPCEVRAVGDVLIDQARYMVRCGFDAFVPADGSTPEAWTAAVHRYRHAYQRAADALAPAFAERVEGVV